MNKIITQKLSNIDLSDPFFETLKADYPGFEQWFLKKASEGKQANVLYDEHQKLQAFLHLKIEKEAVDDVVPILPPKDRLKVATLKVNPHGTRLGERFMKKILDNAFHAETKEVYVTVFPKHEALVQLFQKYGFRKVADKGEEWVLLKSLETATGDILLDYPMVNHKNSRKFLLSVYPKYHTRLFADSMLKTESYEIVKDVTHTNSIHKIYICGMRGVEVLKRGDVLLIYRTSDDKGPAFHRSVATSICVVEELSNISKFPSFTDYFKYCGGYSVFSEKELKTSINPKNIPTLSK